MSKLLHSTWDIPINKNYFVGNIRFSVTGIFLQNKELKLSKNNKFLEKQLKVLV